MKGLLLALGAANALCGCATPPLKVDPGVYCIREALVGDTGLRTFPLGDFQMKLDVVQRHGRVRISFWNSMPDSQEILAADALQVSEDPAGNLHFTFEDGWGNGGRGHLTPKGAVTLKITQRSPDPVSSNIGRNYGTFQLRRGKCDF